MEINLKPVAEVGEFEFPDSWKSAPFIMDGNFIYNYENIDQKSTVIRFSGKNNILFVSPDVKVANSVFDFRASNSVAFIDGAKLRADIMLGHGCVVYVGKDTTFTNKCHITAAEDCDIFIGKECMVAEGVYISNTDGHPIYDESGRRVNLGASVYIGDHVWLGRRSEVLKGVKIHSGGIVGSHSVVTKDVASNAIAVGVPARCVKNGVFFSRTTTVRKPGDPHERVSAPALYAVDALGDVGLLDSIRAWASTVTVVDGAGS